MNTESEQAMDETKRAVRNAIQIMQSPRVVTARLLVLLCYLFLLTEAGAGSSTEQLRATVDKVLTIVRSSNAKSKTQIINQRAQLIAAIYPRFDFQEMAKRSLGRHWARRSPEEQREFVEIFAALMGERMPLTLNPIPVKMSFTRGRKKTRTMRKWTPSSLPRKDRP